jgi:SpoVK/Ycf46/Vps4 family AAA+-type ATPase
MLYLGVPDSKEAQMNVIRALTRKFRLHPALSLPEVVSKCPFHFTGADFYALCSDAILIAMSRKAEQVDKTISMSISFSALPVITHPQYSPSKPSAIWQPPSPYHSPLLPLRDGSRKGRASPHNPA